MPVFSAAIAAVALAAEVGTVAAISAAVVNVATAVSVVGVGLSVVGAITGNKTLSSVGKYMGYAGIAGGLAGGVIGGVGSAVESAGMGAMVSGDTIGDLSTSFVNGFNQTYADAAANLGKAWTDSPVNPGSEFWNSAAGTAAVPERAVDTLPAVTPTQTAGDIIATGEPADLPITATAVPTTPGVAPIGAPGTVASSYPPGLPITSAGLIQEGMGRAIVANTPLPKDQSSFGKWFEGLDSFQKHAVLTGGSMALQGLGGAAQGMFAAATVAERLDFDRMVNTQRQAQILLENQRSGSTPGVVSFNQNRPVRPAGMISV